MASPQPIWQDWLLEIRKPSQLDLLGQDKKRLLPYPVASLVISMTYRDLIKPICRQYRSGANPLIDLRLGQIFDFQWHFLIIMRSLYDP